MKSKSTLNTFFLFSILLVLGACSSKVEDVNDVEDSALFEFDRVQVTSSESIATNSDWPDLKDQFVVDLRTCFLDRVYLQSIVGEDFTVKSELVDVKRTTDASGCLNWTEKFDYKYLSDEAFYKIEGKIQGIGNFKGIQSYQLAVNPWTGKVVDLNLGSASNIRQLSEIEIADSRMNPLEVEDFTVELTEKQFYSDETILTLDISTIPQVVRRSLNGEFIKEKLSGGKFKSVFHLLSKNLATGQRRVLSSSEVQHAVRKDGTLNSRVEFKLNEGVDQNSIIELGVEVHSVNAKENVGSDIGVMAIKNLDHRFNGTLVDIESDFMTIKSNQKNLLPLDLPGEDHFGFVIDNIQISRGAEGGSNQTSTKRSVDALFDIKMVDSLISQGIKNFPFRISIVNKKTQKVVSTDIFSTNVGDGTVSFRAQIPFNSYDRRYWKEFAVRVEGTRAPYNDILKERIVYINPWLNGKDFGIDSKFGVPPEATNENYPEIFIEKLRYSLEGNVQSQFRVNRSLDMSLVKSLNINLRPKLKFDHNFAGTGNGYENIVNGKYKVRLLILAPKPGKNTDFTQDINLEDFYMLTGDEKDVVIENGLINTSLNLPLLFTDQIYYSLRNLLVLEVSPVEVDAELRAGYFIGAYSGMKKSGTVISLNDSGVYLSSGNLDITKTLVTKLDQLKHKLPTEQALGNDYNEFVKILSKKKIKVPVFDADNLKVVKKNMITSINHTENELKKRYRLNISSSEITKIIKNPSKLSNMAKVTLCHLLYGQKTTYYQYWISSSAYGGGSTTKVETTGELYKKCHANPEQYIDLKKLYHVKKIVEQPSGGQVNAYDLGRNTAYFTSKGDFFTSAEGKRSTRFTQHSLNASLGAEFSKFGFYGGLSYGYSTGTRKDLYVYNQNGSTVSSQFRQMNGYGTSYNVDRYDLRFKARVKSCLLIAGKYFDYSVPKRYVQTGLATLFMKDPPAIRQSSNKRYYVCMKDDVVRTTIESWYYMKIKNEAATDDSALSKNSFVSVMRGDENFDEFRKLQMSEDEVLIFVEDESKDVVRQYNQYLSNKARNIRYEDRMGVGFPGLMD